MKIIDRLANRFGFERRASCGISGNSDIDYCLDSNGVYGKQKKALAVSAYWRALHLIANEVGKLPCVIYKRTDEGKVKATTHAAYNLLRYKPNAEMTAKIFNELLVANALEHGNGYAAIIRDALKKPRELLPLDSRETYAVRKDGKLFYQTTVNGKQFLIPDADMINVRGLGAEGVKGYGILEFAAISLGMASAAQAYSAKYFENSARPAVALETPNAISEEAAKKLKANWQKAHAGTGNAYGTAVLFNGTKANILNMSAKDSQLIESMKFSAVDISNWFGVPPHKLGDSAKSSYSSLEQENQSFLNTALDNWLVTCEQEFRDKLFTADQKYRDSHVVEFMRQALVRADMKTRFEVYTKALAGHPIFTVNEVRELENFNSAGDEYDEIIAPTNNFAPEEDTEPDDDKPAPRPDDEPEEDDDTRAAIMASIDAAQEKIAKRLNKDEKLTLERFSEKHAHIVERELKPLCEIFEKHTGEDIYNAQVEIATKGII